jgi:hypothetical protein
MTNYVYLDNRNAYGCYTVGFYHPDGDFEPESDHSTAESVAARVNFLNGGECDMIQQITIGKYNVCLDVNSGGDLQIRVYPIHDSGVIWDCPIDTFDVYRRDVLEAEILAEEQEAFDQQLDKEQ